MFDRELLCRQVFNGIPLDVAQLQTLVEASEEELEQVLAGAEAIRHHFWHDRVELCAIVNAKSGRCAENCAFCAQSRHHQSTPPVYPLLRADQLLAAAKRAEQNGARCFSLVTSGTRITPGAELDTVLQVVEQIANQCRLDPSVSLGLLDQATARRLADAGCVTYHHNLETARSFFPSICTSHSYQQAVDTIRVAQEAGLRVCSGGILGLGESRAQRLELALTLRELNIDSVPINFLNPVAGTPLAAQPLLAIEECLLSIALFRYVLPEARITICGGRQHQLQQAQHKIFRSGASGMMIGDFLTTPGSALEADRQLLRQAAVRW